MILNQQLYKPQAALYPIVDILLMDKLWKLEALINLSLCQILTQQFYSFFVI